MLYVKNSNKIYFHKLGFVVMLSELNNGQFTKTFHKDGKTTSELISRKDFLIALAYYHLLPI